LNDDALYYNLSKLQRVRVIAARCETSSWDMLMYLFWKEKETI
jgi:hypothetical protein